MWDKVAKQVAFERQHLHRLLRTSDTLVRKCATTPPEDVEVWALGGMLHSFYNGIENIFKRIADGLDGQLPSSEFWHRSLLDVMSKPGKERPAVISPVMVDRLDSYLDFRHFFRHSYTFSLRWDGMKDLVLECEPTLEMLEEELNRFFAKGPGTNHP